MKDVVTVNKEKWKKITEIITLTDFDNLQHQISGRSLRGNLLHKLEQLMYEIDKKNQDVVGFKSLSKNKIRIELIQLRALYKKLRKLIQVPYWNPYEDSDNVGSPFLVLIKSRII
ncbi:MAG: hypothetical protein LC100_00545 [Chitinophagales bacterium]|nr:hypothetical protein [Chitinophagales bacterium]